MKYLLPVISFAALALSPAVALAQTPAEQWSTYLATPNRFPGNGNAVAHYYCKTVAVGLIECQIYDQNTPTARLVGVEVIISPSLYGRLDAAEQAHWVFLGDRLGADVLLTVPGQTPDAASAELNNLRRMYSKTYLIWDPTRTTVPMGAVGPFSTSTAAGGPELVAPPETMVAPQTGTAQSERLFARGSRGEEVRMLQRELIRRNFLAPGLDTGFFGPLTEDALIRYQQSRLLPAFGIFGPLTRQSFMEETGPDETAPAPQVMQPAQNTVTYTDAGYSPGTLRVMVGTAVTFRNESSRAMWTASAVHPAHSVYSGTSLAAHCPDAANTAFDSCAGIPPGSSWTFAFNKAGTWGYHNHLNPSDFGTVIVQGQDAAQTTNRTSGQNQQTPGSAAGGAGY